MKIKMVAVFQAVRFGKNMYQAFISPEFGIDYDTGLQVFTITKQNTEEKIQFHVTNAPYWVLNNENSFALPEKSGVKSENSSRISGEVRTTSEDVEADSQKDVIQTTRRVPKRPLKN